MLKVTHGTRVRIAGKKTHSVCCFGSVEGYAKKNGDDAGAALTRALKHNHELFWLNAEAMVLSNPRRQREELTTVHYGDVVNFDGSLLEVKPPRWGDSPILVPCPTRN